MRSPLPARDSDWNAMEFETGGSRTMTEIIRDIVDKAEDGALADGGDLVDTEGECPLCSCRYRTIDLPWHVGSDDCKRNLLDQAVDRAIHGTVGCIDVAAP